MSKRFGTREHVCSLLGGAEPWSLNTFVSRATHAEAHASLRDPCVLTLRAALRNLRPGINTSTIMPGMSASEKLEEIKRLAAAAGQPLTGAGGLFPTLADPITRTYNPTRKVNTQPLPYVHRAQSARCDGMYRLTPSTAVASSPGFFAMANLVSIIDTIFK